MIVARRGAALLVVALLGATVAAAASLNLAPDSVGATTSTLPRCVSTPLTVLQNLSGSTVVSISIAGLPSSCGGATLLVTLNTGAAVASGSATVPAGGGTVVASLGSTPAVATADQIDLLLVGP